MKKKKFNVLLKEKREDLGLSRKDLEAKTGLSYFYIRNLETGFRGPSLGLLAAQSLSNVLDWDLEEMATLLAQAKKEEEAA